MKTNTKSTIGTTTTEKEEIELTKKMIKAIEKGYGKDKCKGYGVGCANCQGQILLGQLYDHLDILEWNL